MLVLNMSDGTSGLRQPGCERGDRSSSADNGITATQTWTRRPSGAPGGADRYEQVRNGIPEGSFTFSPVVLFPALRASPRMDLDTKDTVRTC